MRNIKNYETVRDFLSGDGNVPPITWYCKETALSAGDGSFTYQAYDTQEEGTIEKYYKGKVGEITPGPHISKKSESRYTTQDSRH